MTTWTYSDHMILSVNVGDRRLAALYKKFDLSLNLLKFYLLNAGFAVNSNLFGWEFYSPKKLKWDVAGSPWFESSYTAKGIILKVRRNI